MNNGWVLLKKIKEENILPLGLFVGVFLFLTFYTSAANIHGDGFRYVFWAQEIVEKGKLLDSDPYKIVDITGDEKTYFHIPYPLTSFLIMSVFQMVGGIAAIKFFTPFFGATTSLFIYLLMRDVNKYIGLISGFGVVTINSYILFGIFPTMESLMLPVTIISLYSYYMTTKTSKFGYSAVAGLSLGLAMSIKQQGIILFLVVLLHGILTIWYRKIKNKKMVWTKSFVIIIIVALLTSALPLHDQLKRNGTLGYIEGDPISSVLQSTPLSPYFQPKIAIYPESFKLQRQRVIYQFPREDTILDVMHKYLSYPLYYSRYPSQFVNLAILWVLLTLGLLILGCVKISKKHPMLFSILLLVLIGEITTTYLTKTPIQKYHSLGLSIYVIFFITGIYGLVNLIRSRVSSKFMTSILIAFFVILLETSFVMYVHEPWYGNSGRFEQNHLNAYEEIGNFVGKNIPKNAIFLTGSAGFKAYSERDMIWPDGGNSPPELYFLLKSNDINYTLRLLEYFGINYIFIEDRLVGRGTGDGWPSGGIVNLLNTPFFEEIYSVEVKSGKFNPDVKEGKFRLYKVNFDAK